MCEYLIGKTIETRGYGYKDRKGNSLLHYAAWCGNFESKKVALLRKMQIIKFIEVKQI